MSELPVIDDAWVLEQRGSREGADPSRVGAAMVEPECGLAGEILQVATLFLTNKECPFRCVMCDLWKYTTTERVSEGAVAHQIEAALDELPPADAIKLYNAGSFFDAAAIPRSEWDRILALISGFDRVIVECHPKLVNHQCVTLAERLSGRLEVAMGLETVDPVALERLNKRMTLNDFSKATAFLRDHDIDVRAFVLLRAPFQDELRGRDWCLRSLAFAFEAGVGCCTVIPTRAGNGAMERLAASGAWAPPTFSSLGHVFAEGLSMRKGRVFVDLWDVQVDCVCAAEQLKRLNDMNLTQRVLPEVTCEHCRGAI